LIRAVTTGTRDTETKGLRDPIGTVRVFTALFTAADRNRMINVYLDDVAPYWELANRLHAEESEEE
jgi:hypothetical protein